MNAFRSGDDAGRWLTGRLKKLETHVREASEIHRLASEGVREVLSDVHTEPALFTRDASERARRYTARISRATMDELRSGGFRLDVMERSNLSLIGRDVDLALEVFHAMVNTLRRRIELLSTEGTRGYEDGQASLSAATAKIGAAVEALRGRWESEGPGRHKSSLLPWRRSRAARLDPQEDPVFRMDVASATQSHVPELQTALREAAEGAVVLSIARYYGEIINHLSTFVASAQALREKARVRLAKTEGRLEKVRSQSQATTGESGEPLLLGDEIIDRVLDRLGIHAEAFLRHGDLPWQELVEINAAEFEEQVRTFIEAQVGNLSMPTLAMALGGTSDTGGDSTELRRRMLDFLDEGQPLMSFNDDVSLRYKGGSHAQYFVAIEVSDDSLQSAMIEACNQMSLPTPIIDVVPPAQPGTLSMRVMQFGGGVPFFAQARRLGEMIEAHDDVMTGKTASGNTSVGPLATALRDLPSAENLPGILPAEIERSVHERAELNEWSGPPSRSVLGDSPAANADREPFVAALKRAAADVSASSSARQPARSRATLVPVDEAAHEQAATLGDDEDTVEVADEHTQAALLKEMVTTGELRREVINKARERVNGRNRPAATLGEDAAAAAAEDHDTVQKPSATADDSHDAGSEGSGKVEVG